MRKMNSFLLSLALLLPAGFAMAQELPLNPNGLDDFLARVKSNAEIQNHYAQCPLDIYGKVKGNAPVDLGEEDQTETCADDPDLCLTKCMEERSAVMCHDLAYVLEDNEDEIGEEYGRMLYAQACATGWPLSCTNRGAGIRNDPKTNDPYDDDDEEKANQCLNATFEQMCADEDGWGCYMVGDSHAYGTGRAVDEAKAKEFFDKACKLNDETC